MVNRTIIEDYVIRHSPMFERINSEYRKPEIYNRALSLLSILLPRDVLQPVIRPKDEGIFLFYFHRELRLLFAELARRIIKLAQSDDQGWLEFVDRFISAVIEGVVSIVEKEPQLYQILEVGMRKQINTEMMLASSNLSVSGEILYQKSCKVINGIFHKVRSNLARKVILQTNLLQETFLKIPVFIGENDFNLLKNMRTQFIDCQIPFPIFYAIFSHHAQTRSGQLFDLISEYLKDGNYDSKGELLKKFPFNLSGMSKTEINQLIPIIQEIADRKVLKFEDKKKDVQLKLNSLREKLNSFFQNSLEEFRQVLIKQQSFDKLRGIYEKIDHKLGDFYHHFQELNTDLVKFDQKVQDLNSLKAISRKDFHNQLLALKIRYPLILNIALCPDKPKLDEQIVPELRESFDSLQKDGRDEEIMLAKDLKRGGFFKEKFELDLIADRYWNARKEILLPIAAGTLLEDIVEILPRSDRVASVDEIIFISDLIEKEEGRERRDLTEKVIDRYRKVIGLLIYDIRGSTFMGTKLEDAKVENEIRNLFNRSMLEVVRNYGGFPIKDTGDGGIVLFAKNILDQIDGAGAIEEDEKAGLHAVQCATAMIGTAEQFVKDNLKHYQSWFKEPRIRKLEFEGGSFAQLPPEYQQIFQIGIGIVAGWSPKEIFFDRNAFGDFDVTGMLVREANMFSKARSPERSMIICDESTLFNIILNSELISFLSPEGSKLNITLLDIEQAIAHWLKMKKKRLGFVHEARNIAFKKLDVRLTDGDQLRLDDVGVSVDDFGLLVDDRGGRVKFAYEVINL